MDYMVSKLKDTGMAMMLNAKFGAQRGNLVAITYAQKMANELKELIDTFMQESIDQCFDVMEGTDEDNEDVEG